MGGSERSRQTLRPPPSSRSIIGTLCDMRRDGGDQCCRTSLGAVRQREVVGGGFGGGRGGGDGANREAGSWERGAGQSDTRHQTPDRRAVSEDAQKFVRLRARPLRGNRR